MHGLESIEPVFHFTDRQGLRVSADDWPDKASRHLAHAVKRVPDDLHTHVQRIYFASQYRSQAETYGALVDLFISLGSRGKALRTQMLAVADAQLAGQSSEFLRATLETSLAAKDVVPGDAISMLSKGFIGSPDIISAPEQASTGNHDPLNLARSHAEYGEFHSARALLEIELLQGRSTLEQEQLLLEIYNTVDEQEAFNKIYAIVDKDKLHEAVKWQALANHFNGEYS